MSGREAIKLLAAHEFRFIRQKGSHVVVQKIVNGVTLTVIVPDHDELRIGTLQSIIRQSGLPREVFEV